MSRVPPIPYAFPPTEVAPTAEPTQQISPAATPEPRAAPPSPISAPRVSEAIADLPGFRDVHKDLLGGESEDQVLARWAHEHPERILGLANFLLSADRNAACAVVAGVLVEVLPEDSCHVPDALFYCGTARANIGAEGWGVSELHRLVTEYTDRGIGKIRPTFALNNLAWAYYCAGEFDAGLELARRSVAEDPRNGPAQGTLAALLWMTGDADGALSACDTAVKLGAEIEQLPEELIRVSQQR